MLPQGAVDTLSAKAIVSMALRFALGLEPLGQHDFFDRPIRIMTLTVTVAITITVATATTTVATPAIPMATPATSIVVIGTPATVVIGGSLSAWVTTHHRRWPTLSFLCRVFSCRVALRVWRAVRRMLPRPPIVLWPTRRSFPPRASACFWLASASIQDRAVAAA